MFYYASLQSACVKQSFQHVAKLRSRLQPEHDLTCCLSFKHRFLKHISKFLQRSGLHQYKTTRLIVCRLFKIRDSAKTVFYYQLVTEILIIF